MFWQRTMPTIHAWIKTLAVLGGAFTTVWIVAEAVAMNKATVTQLVERQDKTDLAITKQDDRYIALVAKINENQTSIVQLIYELKGRVDPHSPISEPRINPYDH